MARFRVRHVNWGWREAVGGGSSATHMMQWWLWDIVFANMRRGRGRKAGNPKPSHRARFRVCRIKQRWREAVGCRGGRQLIRCDGSCRMSRLQTRGRVGWKPETRPLGSILGLPYQTVGFGCCWVANLLHWYPRGGGDFGMSLL